MEAKRQAAFEAVNREELLTECVADERRTAAYGQCSYEYQERLVQVAQLRDRCATPVT